MNENGQAYSTFKLLIAAIVAMAILAILIPIIMQVLGLIKANPTDEATSLLSSLVDSPGNISRTKEVIFEPGAALAASALSSKINIATDQICMSTGEFESDEDALFEWRESDDGDEQRLLYNGNSEQQAKIAIVCNNNLDSLLDDIDFYSIDYDEGNDLENACSAICADRGKCCAIVLERS